MKGDRNDGRTDTQKGRERNTGKRRHGDTVTKVYKRLAHEF
jgi:hypothetical protein